MQERMVSEGSEVSVVNENNDWLNPSKIRLQWRAQNLTSGDGDRLTIKLVGYREENTQVRGSSIIICSWVASLQGRSISIETSVK